MARGKGSLLSPKPVALPQTYNAQRGGFAVNYPLSKKEQKKRIDHDPRLAKKILGRGAWRGVPFVYKRPISPDAKGPSSPVENTLLADAIVDRTLCVRAKWFVGWPGSTFSNQITLSRHYALGTNASNYYYNARGVFPRLDDGRLIRDAYDRRERPGKKRQGAESPADWRRVPRRRANLESA